MIVGIGTDDGCEVNFISGNFVDPITDDTVGCNNVNSLSFNQMRINQDGHYDKAFFDFFHQHMI